jgi:hypothetical protein
MTTESDKLGKDFEGGGSDFAGICLKNLRKHHVTVSISDRPRFKPRTSGIRVQNVTAMPPRQVILQAKFSELRSIRNLQVYWPISITECGKLASFFHIALKKK